jgi:hypothetical protein
MACLLLIVNSIHVPSAFHANDDCLPPPLLRYHPDRNHGSEEAAEKFKEISSESPCASLQEARLTNPIHSAQLVVTPIRCARASAKREMVVMMMIMIMMRMKMRMMMMISFVTTTPWAPGQPRMRSWWTRTRGGSMTSRGIAPTFWGMASIVSTSRCGGGDDDDAVNLDEDDEGRGGARIVVSDECVCMM